jgi:hypothetical protein
MNLPFMPRPKWKAGQPNIDNPFWRERAMRERATKNIVGFGRKLHHLKKIINIIEEAKKKNNGLPF